MTTIPFTQPVLPNSSSEVMELGAPLASLVPHRNASVVIAFTDATRNSPDQLLVGHLLGRLLESGIARDSITLLVATGLHRPMTPAEQLKKLGEEIAATVPIINHEATDAGQIVELGTIDGIPVTANRLCHAADLLISTGVVEPHQYAGYSGGAKTVAIGCAGQGTIAATHAPGMIDQPGVRLGAIAENPFQKFIRAAGKRIGLRYVANALMDSQGRIIACAAGDPTEVHNHLVEQGERVFQVNVTQPAHLAIAGVDSAKGANLYQASRAATYLALCDFTPLLPGAPIILPASIPEGVGEGVGEKRFHHFLSAAASPQELVRRLQRDGFPAGAQRAYVLAKVLARHPVIVVGALHPDVVSACHMHPVQTMEEALALAQQLAHERFPNQQLHLLNIPNALACLPRLQPAG